MKRRTPYFVTLLLASVLPVHPALDAQTVTNVRLQQLTTGGHPFEVLYDLTAAPASGAAVTVAFGASPSGPFNINPAANELSGDVGNAVTNGTNKRIIWSPGPGLCSTLYSAVTVLECSFTLNPASASYGASGGTGQFTITASDGGGGGGGPGGSRPGGGTGNGTCPRTATSNAPWLTVTSGASGTGSGIVGYFVATNTGAARTGTITAGGQTFTVNQEGGCASFTVSPSSISADSGAGNTVVSISGSPSGCTGVWSASTSENWISVGPSSGTGTGSVTVYYLANPSSSQRQGGLTIAGKTVTVTQAASGLANEITITLPGGVPLVMVKIPKGTFQMGSPTSERNRNSDETLHEVTLTQDYYIAKYEVTQKQWKAVMGKAMPTSCGSYGVGDDYPVYCVSWNDIAGAGGFIEKLNQQQGTTKFRLPTEAEWERAARAGTQTRFSFGDALSGGDYCEANEEANPYVWWCVSAGNASHVVGTKSPNGYGPYDMHGNVWEWVQDWYDSYPSTPQTNPPGPSSGADRVIRGGSWTYYLQSTRSAFRFNGGPDTRGTDLGFRPARSQ